jgi:hypothetical protein
VVLSKTPPGSGLARPPTRVLFDWDREGWQSFVSDPEVPPILQEAGHKSRPQVVGSLAVATRRRTGVMRATINVGVIADQTGALAPLGGARANTATLVWTKSMRRAACSARRVELLIEQNRRRLNRTTAPGEMTAA